MGCRKTFHPPVAVRNICEHVKTHMLVSIELVSHEHAHAKLLGAFK